ncbi:MAG TPA: HlyD family type I secretion periplasmic adaptor subunit [Dongiaceae bacterium]|nr:HlyD family type I secretion periplasmic adaptor subunit [Dongiaceae bacterium]
MSRTSSNVLPLARARAPRRDAALPVVLEFQWPSTAIVNAPIPRSARRITWMVASMVFVLIAIMGLIPVDEVVTSKGIVVSQAPNILVQPLETAIVRSINVREGQVVHAGEVLAQLDPTFATADAGALTAQAAALEAEVARLQAEADGKPFTYSGDDAGMKLQASIFAQRLAEKNARLANYDEKMDSLKTAIAHGEAEAATYTERLVIAAKIEGMRKKLAAKRYETTLNTLLATDTRLQMQSGLVNAENNAATAKRDLEAMKAEREAYLQNWAAQVSESLVDKTQALRDTKEQLSKASLRQKLVELRADRDAIVQSVAKVSVGSVLQSGQQFFTLVPVDTPLEIEVNVAGQDNGFVHLGDPVAIKFDTFPYSQYGMAEGSVRTISPDSFTPQEEARTWTGALPIPGSADPYYRARITIDHVGLHDVPAGFRVTPGMPVTADIKVGKRTVLGYLLGKVMPLAQEGMREP